jgi:hypothetical protein
MSFRVVQTVSSSLYPSSTSSRSTTMETFVLGVPPDTPLTPSVGLLLARGRRAPTTPSDTIMAFIPSQASDINHGPTTPSTAECKQKQIHVTLSVAPWLNKSDRIQKDTVCEICLENIDDSRRILKTACCRLLAHCQCLSDWAYTKIRGPWFEGASSFTCPKCRTLMDLTKFKQQVPRTITLIDEPWALPSYDIEITFSPLPQSQYNPWDRPPPGPGHLQRLDDFSEWDNEQQRQEDQQRRVILEHQRRLYEQQMLRLEYQWRIVQQHRQEAEQQRREAERQREAAERQRQAAQPQGQEAEERKQEPDKQRRATQLRQRHTECEGSARQAARPERNEAERRTQNAEGIREREAARQNAMLDQQSGNTAKRQGRARRRQNSQAKEPECRGQAVL